MEQEKEKRIWGVTGKKTKTYKGFQTKPESQKRLTVRL